jgi:hypothetical protein
MLPALVSLPAAGAGPARTEPSVLAIDRRVPGRERLVLVDPLTLHPRGETSVDIAGNGWPHYAFSADRSRLVLALWQPRSLRLVDARRLRVLRDVPLVVAGDDEIKAVAWIERQIVVLVERRSSELALVRVDPDEGRVVASTTIGRSSANVAATARRLVLLLAPIGRIGQARLLVVTADRARTVRLTGISAGSVRARRAKPYTVAAPGLAVSPSEPVAWVIGAGRSAEVDLVTLAVRYRGEPRRPASAQKEPVVGSARHAQWLSPGRLVVTGWDAVRTNAGSIVSESHGVRLLDTAGWTERTIHPSVLLFYVRPPHLLTVGPGASDCPTSVLTAYTLNGVESFRVCERRATGELQFAGRYARLGRVDGRVAVVDLRTGTIVARVRDVRVNALAHP